MGFIGFLLKAVRDWVDVGSDQAKAAARAKQIRQAKSDNSLLASRGHDVEQGNNCKAELSKFCRSCPFVLSYKFPLCGMGVSACIWVWVKTCSGYNATPPPPAKQKRWFCYWCPSRQAEEGSNATKS